MSKPKKRRDSFSVLAQTLQKYMRKQGWDIVVISGPTVRHYPTELKYNYELVFRFTGSQLEKK